MTTKTTIDSASLLAAANALEGDMVRFLRDLVAIPGESSHEGPVIQRIKQEMEHVGFDEVRIDGMGNVLGRIGSGKHVIMMDAHTDTVGVGDPQGMGLGSVPGQSGRWFHLRTRLQRSARRHGQYGLRGQDD